MGVESFRRLASLAGLNIAESNGVLTSNSVQLSNSCVLIPDDGYVRTDRIDETTSSHGIDCSHKINLLGESTHGGLAMGCGSAGAGYAMGSGGARTLVSLYAESTYAGDSNRTIYARLYVSGAAGGGEAVRAFGTGTAAGLVALRGIHASTSISGSGTVAGVCEPIRATLQVPNSTLGGTCYGVHSELYSENTSSNASNIALFGASLTGNATGVAALDDVANLFNIQGNTIGTGNLVVATAKASATHSIRIKVGSTTLYLMAADAAS